LLLLLQAAVLCIGGSGGRILRGVVAGGVGVTLVFHTTLLALPEVHASWDTVLLVGGDKSHSSRSHMSFYYKDH
jgi:hypothetical protein